jgi:hypothetical protein
MFSLKPRPTLTKRPYHSFDALNILSRPVSHVQRELITYPVDRVASALSTHQLDLLACCNYVLIVGTDLTHTRRDLYPRQSLTNSIEAFLAEVMRRYPWIMATMWDLVEVSDGNTVCGVSLFEERSESGPVWFSDPRWTHVEGSAILQLLSPAPECQLQIA